MRPDRVVTRMNMLELYSGTSSVGNAFKRRGHKVLTVDWDERFDADLHMDVMDLDAKTVLELLGKPDVIWASPDCTTYSVAAISHHRRRVGKKLLPATEYASRCDKTNWHVMELIRELNPKCFFIENPRAAMRRMDFVADVPRYTVTYCQYGDFRMKPTDIWTDHPDPKFKPPCKNGDPCHERAPRGSRRGTQRFRDRVEKARIPEQLCEHIVDICEELVDESQK